MSAAKQTAATPAKRPRDAQATRELLLAAATQEFAEYGLAGARIDRIAERAGANKRLLYVYFGDKDQLFDVVLQREAEKLATAVPLNAEDLVAFAAARFDYFLANPHVSRLATWRAFERAEPTESEQASYLQKVQAVEAAQRAGKVNPAIAAVDLFAMVLRISDSWLTAPRALLAVAEDHDSEGRINEHRAAVIAAVQSFTAVQ
ncbi:TetR family transcriptional regulator [Streptomyces sp. NPDC001307]|uniref:TetR family transcriptional regulator n=1 Tax=Streptomyces sp. NPDC001307 TaxID=3364560 RepID=UPI0036884A7B